MMSHRLFIPTPRRGFTLIEVVITIAISATMMLAIISSLIFSMRFQALQRQRVAAITIAQQEIESLHTRLFPTLTPYMRAIRLDDNHTPLDATDDRPGVLELSIWHKDGTPFGPGERPVTVDRLLVEVKVSWSPSGDLSELQMHETLMTILTP